MGSVIENTRTKEKCQIFTPDDIVKDMLDYLGYSDNLYGKTIICFCFRMIWEKDTQNTS